MRFHQRSPAALNAWPDQIQRLERQLWRLDGEVRQFEICAPGKAQELRLKAARVATMLEFAKRAILREEGLGP